MKISNPLLIIALLALCYCSDRITTASDEPAPVGTPTDTTIVTPNITTTGIQTVTGGLTVSGIQISWSDLLKVDEGRDTIFSFPTLPDDANLEFKFSTIPATERIRFLVTSKQVVIDSGVSYGEYIISMQLKRGSLDTFIQNINKIIVNPVKARQLSYTSSTLNIVSGDTSTNAVKQVLGSRPMVFTVNKGNENEYFVINANTGAVSVKNNILPGNYTLDISVSNVAGSVLFPSAVRYAVSAAPVAPSILVYSPSVIKGFTDQAFTSGMPSANGTQPLSYVMTVIPNQSNITIDASSGVIQVAQNTPVGLYKADVQVANSVGAYVLKNAISIEVEQPLVPSAIQYANTTFTVNQGQALQIAAPQLQGTPPFTFSLQSNPTAGSNISIQSGTGAITVLNTILPDIYNITVNVTNRVGTTTFSDVLSITVQTVNGISYSARIQPILSQHNCISCHGYSYNAASAEADEILDRITRTPGAAGFMPRNGTKLPEDQIQAIREWISGGKLP